MPYFYNCRLALIVISLVKFLEAFLITSVVDEMHAPIDGRVDSGRSADT